MRTGDAEDRRRRAIAAAPARIAPFVHVTPVMTSRRLNARSPGAELHFKCENFQRAGAFKVRGAFNAVMGLSDAEAAAGVYTHSSGNHGGGAGASGGARAASACYVVMPSNSGRGEAGGRCRPYGAEDPFLRADALEAREETANRVGAENRQHAMIHPYDDENS